MVSTKHNRSTREEEARSTHKSTAFRRVKRTITWDQLLYAIDNEPIFQVTTHDGQFWIEPFTGKRVKLNGELNQVARRHYKNHDYWRKLALKTFQEVVYWRWTHFLQENIRKEPRLRFFRVDGVWLNPFDGKWYDCIRRTEGRVTSTTLHEMAKVLSMFDDPSLEMKSLEELREIIEASTAYNAGNAVPAGGSVTAEPRPVAESESRPALMPPKDEAKEETQVHEGAPPGKGPSASTKARKVQRHMLGELPELPGIELAVHYAPHSSVSGDFYECSLLDENHALLAVGDVTGHGVQAALTMAMVHKTLRIVSRDCLDVVDIACRLNEEVAADLLPEQFFSMYLGLLDLEVMELTSLCAGHHPTLIINAAGMHLLSREGHRGGAIGVTKTAQLRSTFKPTTRKLDMGDIVIQYTDGINEAMNPDEEEYGHFRLYANLLTRLEHFETLQGYVDSIAEDAERFAIGKIDDDVTILALRLAQA